jgi:hypothetical protein
MREARIVDPLRTTNDQSAPVGEAADIHVRVADFAQIARASLLDLAAIGSLQIDSIGRQSRFTSRSRASASASFLTR